MTEREKLCERLLDILRRHVRIEDAPLSDSELVGAVYRRFEKSREDYLIDPNE